MPYIKLSDRKKWGKTIDEVVDMIEKIPEDKQEGELNFFVTTILKRSFSASYHNYNKIMGVLECIKQEFYRRQVAPYEDKKIEENGDVQ
jgi:hypothetical protein